MASLLKNTGSQNVTFAFVNASSGAALTGATPAGKRTIDGAAQASVTGSFTEQGLGQYLFQPSQADTNGTSVGFLFTAASAIPVNMQFFTDPGVMLTQGTGSNQISLSSGAVTVTSNIKKNSASRLTFTMTDSTTHNPKTGVSVSGSVSIDGAAFVSLTNAVTEIANGDYTVVLAAADTNGNTLMFRFTGTSSDDLNIMAITQP